MKYPRLEMRDGFNNGRCWLRTLVKKMQGALAAAGFDAGVDGYFGEGTSCKLKDFQEARGLAVTGVVDEATWRVLEPHFHPNHLRLEAVIAEQLSGFRGDLAWVHDFEGHHGSAYWPGGASGITLDPGMDLGYANAELIESLYQPMLTPEQFHAVQGVLGMRGSEAKKALDEDRILKTITISRHQADEVMPYSAKPYWDRIVARFPCLLRDHTPATVQMVMLSLSYNRGSGNSALDVLAAPLDAGDWHQVGYLVGGMQQGHTLEGVGKRRTIEGAVILRELVYTS